MEIIMDMALKADIAHKVDMEEEMIIMIMNNELEKIIDL